MTALLTVMLLFVCCGISDPAGINNDTDKTSTEETESGKEQSAGDTSEKPETEEGNPTEGGSENSGEEEAKIEEEMYATLTMPELEVMSYDGNAEAAYQLGIIYDYGTEETDQNLRSAREWYQRAADLGLGKAHTALGYLYLNGIDTEISVSRALQEFEQGQSAGDMAALTGIGRTYIYAAEKGIVLNDSGDGVPETPDAAAIANRARAMEFIQRAYDAKVPDAALYLGYLYDRGIGTEANYDNAYNLYTEAVENASEKPEYAYVSNEAHTNLGLLLINAPEGKKDDRTAFSHFEEAAKNGSIKAQYYLALTYLEGIGTSKDNERAFAEMQAAAEKDYAPALNQLGSFYFNGIGTERNLEQTVFYQKRAAAQGYTPAQVNLGFLYENGYGVEQNLQTALAYYQLAAGAGYEGAAEAIARVETLLNE